MKKGSDQKKVAALLCNITKRIHFVRTDRAREK